MDPYRFTHRLLHLAEGHGLRVFDRTMALGYKATRSQVTVETDRRAKIACKRVFFATGYETRDILPKKTVKLKSTYAFISEPLAALEWWKDRAVIWGTGDPYLYMRTTGDNRVIVGGEDDAVLNPAPRRPVAGKNASPFASLREAFPASADRTRRRVGRRVWQHEGRAWLHWQPSVVSPLVFCTGIRRQWNYLERDCLPDAHRSFSGAKPNRDEKIFRFNR